MSTAAIMAAATLPALADALTSAGETGPAAVWRHFHTLCTTPRVSKHETLLRDKLRTWAEQRDLACEVDAAGNLIIRKGASAGAESSPGVVMQGHIDMVCQANQGVDHDFHNDPLSIALRDGWVIAEHTTLGADNGIGVALMLAVLEQSDLRHGPLEVLLTVDEEDGMGGAHGLASDTLQGTLLLNLDTEEWGEFYIGCAGGLDVEVSCTVERAPLPARASGLLLTVSGLCGGHSGADIHLGRGNANKLLVRALSALAREIPISLIACAGGTARNAIPREAWAQFVVAPDNAARAGQIVAELERTLRAELAGVDDGIALKLTTLALPENARVVASAQQQALLAALHAAPHAVRRMSPSVAGVVETSNNLGTLQLDGDAFACNLMVRSLVDSAGQALGEELASLFRLAGCKVSLEGHYPGWRPNAESPLLARCRAVYAREFGAEFGPGKVQVIHAGLECGIIGSKYPQLDMVSFGPTIRGAHAPGERVEIAGVTRCWHLLVAILADLADLKKEGT